MKTQLKLLVALCLIISVAIATTNNYTCSNLSLNDNGSWNVESPDVKDDDVTDLTLSAKCGPDIEIKSDDPAKASLCNVNGEITATFKKGGQTMSETVSFDDFVLSE